MQAARAKMGQCMRDAHERCQKKFHVALGGCFDSASGCLTGCLRADEHCREEPQEVKQGCRLACTSDQKVAMRKCRVEPDQEPCRAAAKTKTVACREQCTKDAAPKLRACKERLGACLEECARAADAQATGNGPGAAR